MARRYPRPKKFRPKNPHKYVGKLEEITSRSSWEMRFMDWCDRNPSVIQWNSEGVIIPYYSQADQKNRRYFVDFIVKMRADTGAEVTVLIEIKPHYQTIPPRATRKTKRYLTEMHEYQVNQDKWHHADAWAKKNGCIFRVMDEYDLGIAVRR